MIASFKQPRYSVLFAAMVVAVGLVTLTDAQAHEPKVVRFHEKVQLSPEAEVFMKALEAPISVDLRSASVADTIFAISTATGTTIRLADGAADPALRLNVKAETLPAHMVLMESMSAVGLAVKFTDTGIEVIKAPEEHAHGHGDRVRIVRKIERSAEHSGEPLPLREPGRFREAREFRVENLSDGTSTKRRVTLKGQDGATSGTLEVEVLK